jgi:hypothetical protein
MCPELERLRGGNCLINLMAVTDSCTQQVASVLVLTLQLCISLCTKCSFVHRMFKAGEGKIFFIVRFLYSSSSETWARSNVTTVISYSCYL